jgi:hypothetical protein
MSEHDEDEINIYDAGHFEGLQFKLNEELTTPDGGKFDTIDCSHVFAELPEGLTMEDLIRDFLLNFRDSVRLDPEDEEDIQGLINARQN